MATNPMDGYRDIHPWPWHWSRDIAGECISNLSVVEFVYDNLDFWTYNNHWSAVEIGPKTPADHCVDIYWSDEGEERLQLPLDVGDHVASLLIFQVANAMKLMLWNHQKWTLLTGWTEYTGEQGDFVDHIHVEFRESA